MDDEVPYSLEEAPAEADTAAGEASPERVTHAPLPAAPPPSPSLAFARFGPSPRARAQRRLLAWVLSLLVVACLYLLLVALRAQGWPWLEGLGALVCVLAIVRIHHAAARSLAGREVQLGPLGIELRRDGFKRLLVFDSVRHLRLVQSPGGRLHSLRLDLDDGSVSLRDVQGLERIFAAAAQGRPEGTLIEVEERRVDWEEPLPWIILVLGLAALGTFLYFLV